MSKVVSLNPGVPIRDVRKVDENVVQVLEKALEEAKAGELVGVCMAKVYYDMQTHQASSGVVNYATIGRLYVLIDRVASDLREI